MFAKVLFDSESAPELGDLVYAYLSPRATEYGLPPGIWQARLTKVDQKETYKDDIPSEIWSALPPGFKVHYCDYSFVDPKLPARFNGTEFEGSRIFVSHASFVLTPSIAMDVTRHLLTAANTEIKSLNRRLEIERQVVKGLFAAIAGGSEALARLEKTFADFTRCLSQKSKEV